MNSMVSPSRARGAVFAAITWAALVTGVPMPGAGGCSLPQVRPRPMSRQGLQLAGLRVGYDTIADAERRLGRGLVVTGGHPQGARVWRSRQTGWYLSADGFHYRTLKGGALSEIIDTAQISVNWPCDHAAAPVTSLPRRRFTFCGAITLRTRRASVNRWLRRSGKRFDTSGARGITWVDRGPAQGRRGDHGLVWRVTLTFDSHNKVDSIAVDSGSARAENAGKSSRHKPAAAHTTRRLGRHLRHPGAR